MNILIKPVKTALVRKYGFKNVSVKNGKGTAWGWVDARITVLKPKMCQCKEGEVYCQECKNTINQVSQEALKIGHEAVKNAGLKFYTYTSGDGYGSESSEFLVQVSLK